MAERRNITIVGTECSVHFSASRWLASRGRPEDDEGSGSRVGAPCSGADSDVSRAATESRGRPTRANLHLHVLGTRDQVLLAQDRIRMHAVRNPLRLPTNQIRLFGTSAGQPREPKSAALSPRWFTDLRHRIKKCLSLQIGAQDAARLRARLDYLDKHWLELSAGREGFLTGARWRGLDRHPVAWGDMPPTPTGFHTRAPRPTTHTSQGHVNNVVYNRYAESGRLNWIASFAYAAEPEHRRRWDELMMPNGVGLILRSIKSDFKLPMTYPDKVTVLHKLAEKPDYSSDSIALEAVILSERHQRPTARCFEDVVVYDYRVAKKAPLLDFMVDELRATYELQEQSKEDVERKVAQLHQELEQIEGRVEPSPS
ncbi:Uncharacterized protein TCAP_05059 [Tolypocladium capitatum]|uniref:Thioesterase/thiol ester dehydrase-isomerase n=1 Tax=Tolypocladium capitatum TaxID=45235 RepID=A0A2K3QBS5_9HYPO|nr:Uncharacterized protein TCAP_05059 [Tolypocladium capitatum]